jgi:GntR family transcriptional regulator
VVQGHYQPGQVLPGEAFLASEYATSRPTIRKAIAQLVGEGLLTVAHGRGTFVRPTPDRRLILMGGSEREDLLSPTYDPAKQGWEHVTVASEAERAAGRGQHVAEPLVFREAKQRPVAGPGSTGSHAHELAQPHDLGLE